MDGTNEPRCDRHNRVVARADAKFAAARFLVKRRAVKKAAYRIQDRLDWRHKRPATHRGYKPLAASYEKRVIKGLPKTAKRMAHGWLAERESLSGKRDRPSLRDGREHGEEIKVQAIQVIHILHVYYNSNSFDLCYFV